ncbi:hypothetical protein KPA94_23050 [Burkholderia semiarida]|uniref:hypothetical protein n=1 Tax=Burkholderia semiarida TaxID=2843303 RepID=UPI0023DDD79D|nr:hypothetical protein [Burkholderia semiarida]MDF3116312.1 hypothetical protein [Burkholderia semiarida]
MAERTKAQQVDQAGYTRRDLATLLKKAGGRLRPLKKESFRAWREPSNVTAMN